MELSEDRVKDAVFRPSWRAEALRRRMLTAVLPGADADNRWLIRSLDIP